MSIDRAKIFNWMEQSVPQPRSSRWVLSADPTTNLLSTSSLASSNGNDKSSAPERPGGRFVLADMLKLWTFVDRPRVISWFEHNAAEINTIARLYSNITSAPREAIEFAASISGLQDTVPDRTLIRLVHNTMRCRARSRLLHSLSNFSDAPDPTLKADFMALDFGHAMFGALSLYLVKIESLTIDEIKYLNFHRLRSNDLSADLKDAMVGLSYRNFLGRRREGTSDYVHDCCVESVNNAGNVFYVISMDSPVWLRNDIACFMGVRQEDNGERNLRQFNTAATLQGSALGGALFAEVVRREGVDADLTAEVLPGGPSHKLCERLGFVGSTDCGYGYIRVKRPKANFDALLS